MKAIFEAKICETATGEIERHLPYDVLQRIKETDPHPFFAMLQVGEEGESAGAVVDGFVKRAVKKIWTRARISELAKKIGDGAKIFLGHNRDNSDRPGVGRLVAGFTAEVGGKLAARAVALVEDPSTVDAIKAGKLDTCSIEADVELTETASGWLVSAVQALTGIALASSATDRPGFAGAGVLAAVQMAVPKDEEPDPDPAADFSNPAVNALIPASPEEMEAARRAAERQAALDEIGKRNEKEDEKMNEYKRFLETPEGNKLIPNEAPAEIPLDPLRMTDDGRKFFRHLTGQQISAVLASHHGVHVAGAGFLTRRDLLGVD